jgi:hypothetical protein
MCLASLVIPEVRDIYIDIYGTRRIWDRKEDWIPISSRMREREGGGPGGRGEE